MNVGRQAIGVFEGADAHKANGVSCSRVIAPQNDAALWTARYLLALSTVRRGVHDLRHAIQDSHAVSFDQGVERKRRAGFPLTLGLPRACLPRLSWVKISQVRTISVERIGMSFRASFLNPAASKVTSYVPAFR